MPEIRRACAQNADYLLLGHVFPTQSKLEYGPPLGLDYLRNVCSRISVPVFGLGGIRSESIAPVLETGAVGIAGISLFQRKTDLAMPKKIGIQKPGARSQNK